MFTVRITYLDCIDEYGYVFRTYEFEDVDEAREFYALTKAEYEGNDLVSVTADC